MEETLTYEEIKSLTDCIKSQKDELKKIKWLLGLYQIKEELMEIKLCSSDEIQKNQAENEIRNIKTKINQLENGVKL